MRPLHFTRRHLGLFMVLTPLAYMFASVMMTQGLLEIWETIKYLIPPFIMLFLLVVGGVLLLQSDKEHKP